MVDFVNLFRARFSEMRNVLQAYPALDNLVSIENGSISNLHIQITGNNHRIIIQKHRGIVNTKVVVMDHANLIEIKEMTGIGGARIVIGGNENYFQ